MMFFKGKIIHAINHERGPSCDGCLYKEKYLNSKLDECTLNVHVDLTYNIDCRRNDVIFKFIDISNLLEQL
jgi:hypothetical protein